MKRLQLKTLLAALFGLFVVAPALAQSFPVPPDIKAIYGSTGWIDNGGAHYAAGTTPNVLGDGSDAKGGTPPAYATMPADIPTPSRSSWMISGSYGDAQGYCTVPTGTFDGHGCPEPKFRTHAMFSHVLYDDPIRNYGQPGTSHCHAFFGNRSINAYSTYTTVRSHRSSTAAGGELNATGYWAPCVQKVIGGSTYAIKYNYVVVYYNTLDNSLRAQFQRLPRGLRYVLGFNMDDPDDTIVKKEIAAANAQPGTAGRYSIQPSGDGHGILGWQCVDGASAANNQYELALKENNGTDPWQNQYGVTCASGTFLMTVRGPDCWDGKNLWSPGGYQHLRYRIKDNLASGDQLVCPNGWYMIPELQLLFTYTQNGVSDYSTWRLSSDDMAATKLNSLPTCTAGYANAPCNDGGGVRTIRNGESFHTDWLGGWDDATMVAWQTNCLGILGGVTAHQCEPSLFSSTNGLNYGPLPDGNTVTTTTVHSTTDTSDMVKLGSAHKGPVTMHHHM